ncbi:acetylglutamate kinase [Halobacillus karajensis]|uniref:Acetylglutamate kinase n=1 Tax=Halobacillus karajensis TaxID=195088 RepID=A0A059NYK5_9BACI|nr:acetylglutamate kinase [Halobacillus karajensis]CDQ18637.1 Acetylglutamate kinase [Halobacillus karajensis]CDQ23291.1 Acetylglutamate kinase [Halobacillus karajensis]CDQ26773.1 Acetylglutamate kinase [Halobacillus karajensis]
MITSKSTQATEPKPILVVKLGGSMLDQLTEAFYESFIELQKQYYCIIVHGGGPAITKLLNKLNIEGEFHNGLRKTNLETMEVVEMVLGGSVSSQITGNLTKQGIKAVGVKGSEASLLQADYLDKENLGFVGKVLEVDATVLHQLLDQGYFPVVAPVGKTLDHETVNINADVAAGAIARSVGAEKLLFVTDVPGILFDNEVMEETTPAEIEQLIEKGTIYGGMIPKVHSAITALSDHLQEVRIVSGEQPLMEDGSLSGTSIRGKRKEKVE